MMKELNGDADYSEGVRVVKSALHPGPSAMHVSVPEGENGFYKRLEARVKGKLIDDFYDEMFLKNQYKVRLETAITCVKAAEELLKNFTPRSARQKRELDAFREIADHVKKPIEGGTNGQ